MDAVPPIFVFYAFLFCLAAMGLGVLADYLIQRVKLWRESR